MCTVPYNQSGSTSNSEDRNFNTVAERYQQLMLTSAYMLSRGKSRKSSESEAKNT